MIDNFMRYLSEALPQLRQDETTLENERELISAYLRIHQIRMGCRLRLEFELPQELRTARVPTLILLTPVENALKHGVDPVVVGGQIRVTAACEHSALAAGPRRIAASECCACAFVQATISAAGVTSNCR
jgi:LytS/YehU family sensor histidine kinase